MRKLTLLFWLLAACNSGGTGPDGTAGGGGSGGSGGSGGGGGGSGPMSIEESLQSLGVSQDMSTRVDALGHVLPSDWTPLGRAAVVNRLDELYIRGNTAEGLANVYEWRDFGQNDPDQFRPLQNLDSRFLASSWFKDATAVAGDFDRDGREELLAVSLDDDAAPTPKVIADLVDDAVDGYVDLGTLEVDDGYPRRIGATAGDFDGDGADEAAIAVCHDDYVEVFFVKFDGGALKAFGPTIRIDRQSPGVVANASLVAGQIDTDPELELAFVVNERFGNGSVSGTFADGTTRFYLCDDAVHDFAELASGPVSASAGGATRTARAADLAFADIDADGFDELVLGGLTRFGEPDASSGTTMGYVLYALDDSDHGLAALPAHWEPFSLRGLAPRPGWRWVEHVHVEAPDLDGDTNPEIQLAESIFRYDPDGASWNRIGGLPLDGYMFLDASVKCVHDEDTTLVATGRIIDRTRDNLLTYSYDLGLGISVWGMIDGQLVLEDRMADVSSADAIQPIDLDADSLALEYVEGSYHLVFTEPIVLAVLSAAPCGVGQDPSYCRTQYGISDSTTAESEQSVSITAGVVVGIEFDPDIPLVNLSASEVFTISETVERSTAQAYEVTETVEWETGPIEDSVIFTAIPYDQYRYRIIQPGTDEALRGREILVSIPRRPVQLMVSRAFFDAHVPTEADRIEPAVLPHTPGDPRSYYTAAAAAQLIGAYGGIATLPRDVGEGSGNVTVTLEVGTAWTAGISITAAWVGDVQGTAGGVVAGFSMGESTTNSLRVTTGRKLIYRGRVGQIDAAHISENAYSFGLFAYPYGDLRTGRAYQVLSYWVTPLR